MTFGAFLQYFWTHTVFVTGLTMAEVVGTEVAAMAVVAGTAMVVATAVGVMLQASVALALLTL